MLSFALSSNRCSCHARLRRTGAGLRHRLHRFDPRGPASHFSRFSQHGQQQRRTAIRVQASFRQSSRQKQQGVGLMGKRGPWWLLAAVLPATGVIGALSVALFFGTLGVVSALLWATGVTIASLLGLALFAPWLIFAASVTAAFTLPLTLGVGFFVYQRLQKARLAQEMQDRKAAAEAAAAAKQPMDQEQQEAARLDQELRDFDDMLGRRR